MKREESEGRKEKLDEEGWKGGRVRRSWSGKLGEGGEYWEGDVKVRDSFEGQGEKGQEVEEVRRGK